jgi:rubrerythrin
MELEDLEGTRTEQNLACAIAGEAIARAKYTAFAQRAQEEGHKEAAQLLKSLSVNEDAHCQLLCRHLFETKDTAQNLTAAADGERYEWGDMYPSFVEIAEREGFDDIAQLFRNIAKVERDHEFRFQSALAHLGEAQPTSKQPEAPAPAPSGVRCVRCGTVYPEKPDECNLCRGSGPFIPV